MKPDNAKLIVIFNKLNWQSQAVDLAVPVGKRIPPRALKWLKDFATSNNRPLLYTEQTIKQGQFQQQQQVFAYGTPEFQQDQIRWQQEGKKLW